MNAAGRGDNRASIRWNGHVYVVAYKGLEYARFPSSERKNAVDYAHGFNAGLTRRGRP